MPNQIVSMSTVTATVEDVLPGVGLAYLVDDNHREWAVTRSTNGLGLESLRAGQQVKLKVEQHKRFAVVREYTAAH